MKKVTLEMMMQIIDNSGIMTSPLSDEQKETLTEQFNNKTNRESKVDPRINVIRALVAKGIPNKDISNGLGIQSYQVRTAFYGRKTIGDEGAWTTETLKDSEYKNMRWSPEVFNEWVQRPNTKDFTYSNLENFRDILVEEPVMEVEAAEVEAEPKAEKKKK